VRNCRLGRKCAGRVCFYTFARWTPESFSRPLKRPLPTFPSPGYVAHLPLRPSPARKCAGCLGSLGEPQAARFGFRGSPTLITGVPLPASSLSQETPPLRLAKLSSILASPPGPHPIPPRIHWWTQIQL